MARVEGRIVEYRSGAKGLGKMFKPASLTFDLKIVESHTGKLIMALHHRELAGSPGRTPEEELRSWIGKLWKIEGRGGGLWDAYRRGKEP